MSSEGVSRDAITSLNENPVKDGKWTWRISSFMTLLKIFIRVSNSSADSSFDGTEMAARRKKSVESEIPDN